MDSTTTAPTQRNVVAYRRPHRAAVVVRAHASALCWPLRALLTDDIWVTTRAWVRSHDRLLRPDLCVLSGDPPPDGVAARLTLAVVWAPVTTAPWPLLDAGAGEVWTVTADRVTVHREGAAGHGATAADGALTVPGTEVTVPVDSLLLRPPQTGG